jgi:Na+/proline symporter
LPDILGGLSHAPGGVDKLQMFDFSLNLTSPYALAAAVTGLVLINAANAGLDQDTTQRLLACENARQGNHALYASVWASIPVILLFLCIGALLHIFYERPDLMGQAGGAVAATFQGEKISVFMHFILSEIPPGLRGLVVVGVIAAAAINSGLISMAAVLINDFYRPWVERKGVRDERHYITAGRIAVVALGSLLFAMSILCFYWQRYSNLPLLDFVLGVMAFAYSGLLGVYITAIFSGRGSSRSVMAALAIGFLTILAFQGYVVDSLGLPGLMKTVAFPWQLCLGTAVATFVCMLGRQTAMGNVPVYG